MYDVLSFVAYQSNQRQALIYIILRHPSTVFSNIRSVDDRELEHVLEDGGLQREDNFVDFEEERIGR